MSKVLHFDLQTQEPQKAVDFYSKVFGWKFQKWEGPMEYWMIETGPEDQPGIGGGLSKGEPLARSVNTIGTADIDAALKAVEENGGKVTQPKGPIQGVGWFAAFQGPDGNAFGLMQDDPGAK